MTMEQYDTATELLVERKMIGKKMKVLKLKIDSAKTLAIGYKGEVALSDINPRFILNAIYEQLEYYDGLLGDIDNRMEEL